MVSRVKLSYDILLSAVSSLFSIYPAEDLVTDFTLDEYLAKAELFRRLSLGGNCNYVVSIKRPMFHYIILKSVELYDTWRAGHTPGSTFESV